MPSETVDIRIAMPDRRVLLARLCEEIGLALARGQRWERDDALVPWHASAATFEALPARVVEAILDEWAETGDRLGGIEFSGYLETDLGPRAWGCLTVHEGQPRELAPELEACTVELDGGGYRLEARLRLRIMDGADA